MQKPQVAVQLIVFGGRARTDMAGVLAAVAEAGYDGFEGGVPRTSEEADEVRRAAGDRGLIYVGGHCGEDQWTDAGGMGDVASLVKAVGGDFVFASGGASWHTLDHYREGVRALQEAGARCRDAGLTFCYHNHAWELKEVEGTRGLHYLVEQTDPELVSLCPDVYWLHVGGEDPAAFIARHRDRCPCYHFKDGLGGEQSREFRELGRGCVDLESALSAALAGAPKWIITEQDSTDGDPAESARVSRDYLRGLGL